VQSDRVHSALALAREYQACVILKGSGSIIATASGKLIINNTGKPSLASPGTGDVLAGLCGALLAQGMPTWEAALAAVYCHGAAADVLLSQGSGPAGLIASELMPMIRTLINRYTSGGSTCLQNL
jgi:NAD(P)H-hydrate repair Nnr-like enzyme with NAD(P)H-hydrate dehydratase domain